MRLLIPGLQRRKTRYYYRRRIPAALQDHFQSRTIGVSLRTACPKEAQQRLLSVHAQVETLFEEVRTITSQLNHSRARQIADDWRRRTLNEDLERRIQGSLRPTEPDSQRHHLAGVLQKMDFASEAGWINQVGHHQGLTLETGSPDWKRLAFHLVQAQLEALQEIGQRDMSGNQTLRYYDTPEPEAATPEVDLRLSAVFERWQQAQERNERTLIDWQVAITRFIELKGDLDVRRIQRRDVREFAEKCRELPRHMPKHERRMTLQQLVARYKDKPTERLASGTINKYLTALKSVLALAVKEDWLAVNPALGVSLETNANAPRSRVPFALDDLHQIFMLSPVFRHGERSVGGAGEAAYWLPLMALYSGARLEELGQLRLTDIRQEGEIAYFDINRDDPGKSLKNASSARRVPLHPALLEAGFLDEVERQRRLGSTHLFPALRHDMIKCTGPFSKWINRYLSRTCGVDDKRKVFHSFRHTFKDACREAEVPGEVQEALMGHSSGKVGDSYGRGFSMRRLFEEISKVKYNGLILPPRPAVLREVKQSQEDGESILPQSRPGWAA
ncbi:MAG: putative Phage integrase [Puniceicoccaceae bacterium 5H]|nr:MAG: putative Phage integrase [Puniceicoccaceae bacterium 5H]